MKQKMQNILGRRCFWFIKDRLAEKVRPTQCAYVMQPPTLKCQPSLHNKRFNDQEMIMYLNDRRI